MVNKAMTFMHKVRSRLSPGMRGALFYGAYWGAIGVFAAYIYVYFRRLGLKDYQIGILSVTLPVATLVISPIVSRLADQYNARVKLLALFSLGYAVILSLLGLPRSFLGVLLLLGLANILRGPIEPLANSLIVRMAGKYQINFGRMRLVGSLVFTVTSIGLGLVWQTYGFGWMFPLGGLLFFSVVGASLLLEEAPAPVYEPDAVPRSDVKIMLKDWVLILLIASSFMVGAAVSMGATFTPIYTDMIGGGEFLMGLIFGVAALGEMPGMELGSRAALKLGDVRALLISYLILTAGFLTFGMTKAALLLLMIVFLRGLGYGLYFVASVMVVDRRAPHYLASTYQSVMMSIAWGLAPLLSGAVSGVLFERLGPGVFFAITGGIVVLAGIILIPVYFMMKREKEDLEIS